MMCICTCQIDNGTSKAKLTTIQEEIQGKLNYWLANIQRLEDNFRYLEKLGKRHSQEWDSDTRAYNEYKGRIFATSQIADILGFELDMNY